MKLLIGWVIKDQMLSSITDWIIYARTENQPLNKFKTKHSQLNQQVELMNLLIDHEHVNTSYQMFYDAQTWRQLIPHDFSFHCDIDQ
jgi:hypothetical protein